AKPVDRRLHQLIKHVPALPAPGYVDLFNGISSTLGLMTYTLRPTDGQAGLEGWMNVGGGTCRKK
ncbi:MAG: hypothetical protein ACKOPS_21115, partial [Cyanobium sp.]